MEQKRKELTNKKIAEIERAIKAFKEKFELGSYPSNPARFWQDIFSQVCKAAWLLVLRGVKFETNFFLFQIYLG